MFPFFLNKKIELSIDDNLEVVKNTISTFIKSSNKIQLNKQGNNIFEISSIEKSSLFIPFLPKYRILIKMEKEFLEINLKGNILASFFSGQILFLSFVSVFLIDELGIIGTIMNVSGMIAFAYLIRYINIVYIKNGNTEIEKLIRIFEQKRTK